MRARLLAAIAVILLLGGCQASRTGRGQVAGVLPGTLCPHAGLAPAAVVSCISADVSTFWTGRLGKPIKEPVIVDPPPASVPADCRNFLSFGTAFFCTNDSTVYLTHKAIERDQQQFGIFLPWALAAIVSHEIGHVVQQEVHQPGLDQTGDAASRRIEQQADCLSGVWAHTAVGAGRLDATGFRAAERRELTLVSALPTPAGLRGYSEVRTHGTVAQRAASLATGLRSGDPKSCDLATG